MGLTDLPGDPESKRGGVTGRILLENALKKILPQILDDYPEFVFMQDGAGIHKKKRWLHGWKRKVIK